MSPNWPKILRAQGANVFLILDSGVIKELLLTVFQKKYSNTWKSSVFCSYLETPPRTEGRYLTSGHNTVQGYKSVPVYTVNNQFGQHWGILSYSSTEQVVCAIIELSQ